MISSSAIPIQVSSTALQGQDPVSNAFGEIQEIVNQLGFCIDKTNKIWHNFQVTVKGFLEERCPTCKYVYQGCCESANLSVNGRSFHITPIQVHMGLHHASELMSISEGNGEMKTLTRERANQIARDVLGMGPTAEEIHWLQNHPIYQYLFDKYLLKTKDFEIDPKNPLLQILRYPLPNSSKYYSVVNFTPFDFFIDNALQCDPDKRPFSYGMKNYSYPFYFRELNPSSLPSQSWVSGAVLSTNIEEASIIYKDASGRLILISCDEENLKIKNEILFEVKPPISGFQFVDVKYDAGWSNQLYLRGSQPSWDKGIKGSCISSDRWRFTLCPSLNQEEYKILLNDHVWEVGPNHKLPPDHSWCQIFPKFN